MAESSSNTCYVLDKGFIRLVDFMGDDLRIVQAARISYKNHNKGNDQHLLIDSMSEADIRLIDYLMRNGHTSPFEHVEFEFHVKCPIFVARQWQRHRTASINEISGRYTEIKEEYHVPLSLRVNDDKNKQVSNQRVTMTNAEALEEKRMIDFIDSISATCFSSYEELRGAGVAREQARMLLPLSSYTEYYWKCDLHNVFNFIRLRLHKHAQPEIRVYANAMLRLISPVVPVATASFRNHVLGAIKLSNDEVMRLKAEAGSIPAWLVDKLEKSALDYSL